MLITTDYDIIETIAQSPTLNLYRAKSLQTNDNVIVKTSPNNSAKSNANHVLEKEWNFLRTCQSQTILMGISMEKGKNKTNLILEDFEGQSLEKTMLDTGGMSLDVFLKVALRIAFAVDSIHSEGIIHLQLEPQNMLVSAKEKTIKLTGFHHAVNEHKDVQASPEVEVIDFVATPYLAPEQMQQPVSQLDIQTDLYALGAIFYHMIAGQPPFLAQEKHKLHQQILTDRPIPLQTFNPAIPEEISYIIMKLLAKSPEKRYQNTNELVQLLRHFQHKNRPETKEKQHIAMRESPDTLPHLYGRQQVREKLYDTYSHIVKEKRGLMLIHGPSGIGKTVLMEDLFQRHAEDRGYFLKASCHASPASYRPIIMALNDLFGQIAAEDRGDIHTWKKKINEHLAPYSDLLTALIAESRAFLSAPKDDISVSPKENLARFRQAIKELTVLFANAKRPLFFFIDDMQWLDWESAALITYLLTAPDIDQLIIVGTYRDDQIYPPFQKLLQGKKDSPSIQQSISVEPLIPIDIKTWIENQIHLQDKELFQLSQMIYRVTQGNPLFIEQLLQTCHDEEVVFHHPGTGLWHIHQEKLKMVTLKESILELTQSRFNRLSNQAQKLLQLASCQDVPFDSEKLAFIMGVTSEETCTLMHEAIEKGMIVEQRNSSEANGDTFMCQFLHDKIRQAIADTLTEEQKKEHHFKTGTTFLQLYEDEGKESHLFTTVRNFNRCHDLISSGQQHSLAEWNLAAGNKAKRNTAFSIALDLYEHGLAILPSTYEKSQDKLAFRLQLYIGEAAYLNLQFSRAESVFNNLLNIVTDHTAKSEVYNMQMLLYTHTQQTAKAVEAGLSALGLYDVKLDPAPNKLSIAKEFFLLKWAVRKPKNQGKNRLHELSTDSFNTMMRTLTRTVAPAFLENQNLAALLILKAMRYTRIRKENEQYPIVSTNYALILSTGLHDYENSYQHGIYALQKGHESDDLLIQTTVHFTYAVFIHHLKHPLHEVPNQLKAAQQTAIQTGELNQATAASSFIGAANFASGKHLSHTEEKVRKQLAFISQHFSRLPYDYLREMLTWIKCLKNVGDEIAWEKLSIVNEDASRIMHDTLRLQMTFLLKNENEAIDVMQELNEASFDTLHLLVSPDCFLYIILWQTKMIRHNKRIPNYSTSRIKKLLGKLKKYAESAPINYHHKFLLAKAEWLFTKNKSFEALRHYQWAVEAALQSGHLLDIALVNECTAHFYRENNFNEQAVDYFHKAYKGYHDFGAANLAESIKTEFLKQDLQSQPAPPFNDNQEAIDVHVLFEAGYVMASESSPEKVLRRLMSIIHQYAQADRTFLLLSHHEGFQIAATILENDAVDIHPSTSPAHPEAIIEYVAEHLEVVLLNDATHHGSFTTNQDIIMREVKSVLALPIFHQGELTGVLYMENNHQTHTFNGNLVLLLTLLSSQAAITLENERWYDELELKIKNRTMRLQQTNQSLSEEKEKRRELLSKVAHDLRSPLAVVNGYIEIIFNGTIKDAKQQEKYVQAIKKRLLSMDQLLNDLMELAQLELNNSDKFGFQLEFIPADQLLHYLSQKFVPGSQVKTVQYQWVLPEPAPKEYPLVEVDKNRIGQVVENLLNNAVAHKSQTEVCVSISLETENRVTLKVEDNGTGIPQSEVPHLFDRYYTKQSNGHGLGLVICREIIHKHHGSIWIESEFGSGTTAFISLPIVPI